MSFLAFTLTVRLRALKNRLKIVTEDSAKRYNEAKQGRGLRDHGAFVL